MIRVKWLMPRASVQISVRSDWMPRRAAPTFASDAKVGAFVPEREMSTIDGQKMGKCDANVETDVSLPT